MYKATLWSMVFPLGMYAVAGIYLGRADHLPIVEGVGRVGLWVALATWTVVFATMCVHVFRTVLLSGSRDHHAGDIARSGS